MIKGYALIFLSGFQVGTVDEVSCCSLLYFQVLVNENIKLSFHKELSISRH